MPLKPVINLLVHRYFKFHACYSFLVALYTKQFVGKMSADFQNDISSLMPPPSHIEDFNDNIG
jgi:hypothetical protein